ncbi:MAG TPA: SDR family oxidoreductase [Thermoanaerobaculia bacterium]|nr:SDR family oxidoreductase [Thermoanaerobaculia bacterium]
MALAGAGEERKGRGGREKRIPAALWAGAAGVGLIATMAAARAVRRRPPVDFKDKVVLITGGSRGLGLLIARELATQGARLAIVARDPEELDLARRELAAVSGLRVLALPCDVRDQEEAEWAVGATVERFGRLDVLINNAGVIQVGPMEHMDLKDFEDALKVHFWGPLYLVRAALPHLKKEGEGRIVNVSSIGGKVALPHLLPYSASKFALTGLSNGLRVELAKDGVYVTTVCPGLMRTGSHVHALFKGKRRQELAWFAVSDSTPLTSIGGRRAARRIVEACRYGEPHLTITPQARIAALAATVAPGLTARLLEVVESFLPDPSDQDGDEPKPGWQYPSSWAPSLLTRLSDEAAVENNELRGEAALSYSYKGNGKEQLEH